MRETRRLARRLRERARGRGAQAKLAAARRLEEVADRAEKVARQIRQRLAGEKITDRLVSIADPDARPVRKGKLRQPTEFGYVFQLCELTENSRRGARGLALDGGFPPSAVGAHLSACKQVFIAGRRATGGRRTDRRLARYRVGCEGHISHLKRGYGLKRSRLKGDQGARTWTAWSVLAYNLDTLAIRTA